MLPRRSSRLAIPSFFLLLAVVLAAFAAGCGGGGNSDKDTEALVERFLEVGQSVKISNEVLLGRLPDDLPEGLPQYPDADLVASTISTGSGAKGYGLLLEAGDDFGKVFTYYEEALDTEPWQLLLATSQEDGGALQFGNLEDPNLSGTVLIQPSTADDGKTLVFLSVQTFLEDATQEPFEMPSSRPLPRGFPAQMPIYQGATVTQTGWARSQTGIEFQVGFLAKTTPQDIIDFYRTELRSKGWVVTDEPTSGSVMVLKIENKQPGETWSGTVSATVFGDAPEYTEATLQLSIGSGETASPTSTLPTPSP